jgi:hypothetical protein
MNIRNNHAINCLPPRLPEQRLAATLCSLLLAATLEQAHAQPEPGPELAVGANGMEPAEVRRADVPTLKATYLDCDRHASERLLDQGEVMRCSQVAEALLVRVFKGDFNQLMAWWNTEKALRLNTRAARLGYDPGNRP